MVKFDSNYNEANVLYKYQDTTEEMVLSDFHLDFKVRAAV